MYGQFLNDFGFYGLHLTTLASYSLGSCGSLNHSSAPVGTVVVPKACVTIARNVNFDFGNPDEDQEKDTKAYFISKPVSSESD